MVLSVSSFPLPMPPPYYTKVAVIHFSSFTLANQVFWAVEGRLEWSSGFECMCYHSSLAMWQLAAASSLQILIAVVSFSSLAKWTSEGFWENEMQQCMYKAKCDTYHFSTQNSEELWLLCYPELHGKGSVSQIQNTKMYHIAQTSVNILWMTIWIYILHIYLFLSITVLCHLKQLIYLKYYCNW